MSLPQGHYQKILHRSVPISREAEQKLLEIAQTSTPKEQEEAEHLLLVANTRFVFRMSIKYAVPGTDRFDRAFSSAMFGLLKGIRGFDRSRNLKLITYAVWWIRQSIQLEMEGDVRRFGGLKGAHDHLQQFKRQLSKIADKDSPAALELHRKITDIELSLAPPAIRIGTEARTADGHDEVRDLEDTSSLAAFDNFDAVTTNRKFVSLSLAALDPVDQRIVSLYYGLDGCETHTLLDIVNALVKAGRPKMSRERVRQRLVRSTQLMHKALIRRNVSISDICRSDNAPTEAVR